jgi:hypothetical protein
MTLSCESRFQKRTYGPGIYINDATIVDCQDISGQVLPFLEHPLDIGFKLFLDIGRDFQPELLIGGNFKKDQASGEVIGWGSGFLVQEALAVLTGYNGTLEEGNKIPVGVLETLIGKRFWKLSYVSGHKANGRIRYTDWNQIASLEEGPDVLLAKFKRSLAKGYPRNYAPQILDEVALPNTATAPLDESF